MYDVSRSCMTKSYLKVHSEPMDFNVTEDEKFLEIISNSTSQLYFKKLLLVKF